MIISYLYAVYKKYIFSATHKLQRKYSRAAERRVMVILVVLREKFLLLRAKIAGVLCSLFGGFSYLCSIKPVAMKDVLIYLDVPPYLKEWLTHTYGHPVRFPARGVENELLRCSTIRRPSTVPIDTPAPGRVAIALPDCDTHRPEFYNYLPRKARAQLTKTLQGMFTLQLWYAGLHALMSGAPLLRSLDDWCSSHGISASSTDAVRKKFYRLRKVYQPHGVKLIQAKGA